MKKSLYAVILIGVAIAACDKTMREWGQGGVNACQFVQEQVPELREDIESIKIIEEDSLLGDLMLSWGQASFVKAGRDFWQGNINKVEYQHIIDSTCQVLQDVQNSWSFGNVVNDSLKQLTKYDGCWRKVYKVLVTMNSGVSKSPRVLMDTDGITPRMLEKDFEHQLQQYADDIEQAKRDVYEKERW